MAAAYPCTPHKLEFIYLFIFFLLFRIFLFCFPVVGWVGGWNIPRQIIKNALPYRINDLAEIKVNRREM